VPECTRRVERQGRARRLLPFALILLGLALLALVVAALLLRHSNSHTKKGAKSPSIASRPIHLAGVTAYDPFGNNHAEHNDEAGKATDQNPSTFWTTEQYDSFTKPGVGLVLAAPRPTRISTLTVKTDTPGFTARIESGSSEGGPFSPVSSVRSVGSSTTFHVHGRARQYYVVWVTKLQRVAHVNEVAARR
jgi:hypothetical protein